MTKAVKKNPEQSARASDQKRDPTTRRFTSAPHGVVVRRASAASVSVGGIVGDVPPGSDRVTPNPNRAGRSAFSSAQPKASAQQGISSAAAKRALRVSERRKKKLCLNTHYMVGIPCDNDYKKKKTITISTSSSEESTIEESNSSESTVNPVKQLKGKETVTGMETELKRKEKKMDFWELRAQVAESQENIKWLERELMKENQRKARLQAALTTASEKAKQNTAIKNK